MRLDQVFMEAMNLGLEERAELAQRLLVSLDEVPETEIERLWLEEAERRLKEYREGKITGLTTDEVFQRALNDLSR
jgi:putative addiction module component (TIGR02574 family)